MQEVFIVGGRATGKTHRLVQELVDNDTAMMVAATASAVSHARDLLVRLLKEQKGIFGDEAHNRSRRQVQMPWPARVVLRGYSGHIYVDDLRYILGCLLGVDPTRIRAVADNALVETPQGKRFEPTSPNPHRL